MLALGRFGAQVGLGFALALTSLVSSSCNTTPTLPLPPPLATASVPDEQGFSLIEGEAEADAYVSVLNEDSPETEKGVITHALRFTMDRTRHAYIHPATHAAGSGRSEPLHSRYARSRIPPVAGRMGVGVL